MQRIIHIFDCMPEHILHAPSSLAFFIVFSPSQMPLPSFS